MGNTMRTLLAEAMLVILAGTAGFFGGRLYQIDYVPTPVVEKEEPLKIPFFLRIPIPDPPPAPQPDLPMPDIDDLLDY